VSCWRCRLDGQPSLTSRDFEGQAPNLRPTKSPLAQLHTLRIDPNTAWWLEESHKHNHRANSEKEKKTSAKATTNKNPCSPRRTLINDGVNKQPSAD
jgi:hypothetical protein